MASHSLFDVVRQVESGLSGTSVSASANSNNTNNPKSEGRGGGGSRRIGGVGGGVGIAGESNGGVDGAAMSDEEKHCESVNAAGGGGGGEGGNVGGGGESTVEPEDFEDIYPTLDNLNRVLSEAAARRNRPNRTASGAMKPATTWTVDDSVSLEQLLTAAGQDVDAYRNRLAQLRARMYGTSNSDLLSLKQAQQRRRAEHEEMLGRLRGEADAIVTLLHAEPEGGGSTGGRAGGQTKTQGDVQREKLSRWQRALELYVLAPEAALQSSAYRNRPNARFDLLHLLDKLCENCSKEEELSEALSEASLMCNALVDVTAVAVRDAAEFAAETEDAYHIKLEAFGSFIDVVANDAERVGEQFRTNGRAAMRIGQQLELAEMKRRQCETASILIRRWWMMETLAEEEATPGFGEVNVIDEITGKIPPASCRMDPLFTQPGNSLEASRALRALRAVVRARSTTSSSGGSSSGAAAATAAGGTVTDPTAANRFDLTAGLIRRTSAAIESRLLNSFLEIHARGGTYDFTYNPAATSSLAGVRGANNNATAVSSADRGKLDWLALRELAEALNAFDSGRKLHKKYVQQVVTTKFPELFYFSTPKKKRDVLGAPGDAVVDDETSSDDEGHELDLDETRSQLSTLFHRVSHVCKEEFELISHVFSPSTPLPPRPGVGKSSSSTGSSSSSSSALCSEMSETTPFQVTRLLLQRIINDPKSGLQARINELLASVDRSCGDFDAGAKKLDTFVVVHEKAAGLFSLLHEAAERCFINANPYGGGGQQQQRQQPKRQGSNSVAGAASAGGGATTTTTTTTTPTISAAKRRAANSLLQFLTAQETALSNGQRRGYLNLELRLLHHECCAGFDRIGVKLILPEKRDGTTKGGRGAGGRSGGLAAAAVPIARPAKADGGDGTLDYYRAPLLPLDRDHLRKGGYKAIMGGPLKPSVLRQPLIHATDSLARARLMFGGGVGGKEDESTARVITAIYGQMCTFYGDAFLCPVVECLGELLERNPPSAAPSLPLNEDAAPHDLGVDNNFWIGIERVHSAAKAFDRELWAEQRAGSARVWEILISTGSQTSLTVAKEKRLRFFRSIEERGEAAMLLALDALSAHIQWIVIAGESMLATGGNQLLRNLTTQDKGAGGPYAVPAGSSLEATNSPAVQSLTFCLRAQFVHIQAALTPQSLSAFWTALSRRLYDIICARLLQHYQVSNIGAVIFSRDVEALRAVAMLAGTEHAHWDTLKELLTLYMTPPDALRTILVGPEREAANSAKGLFNRAGQDRALVFMSRRTDFRVKGNAGFRTSEWAKNLLADLNVPDPSERPIDVTLYSAERRAG